MNCTTSWADNEVKLVKHREVPTSPAHREDQRGDVWAQRRVALGQRIRTLRRQRGLSQEALALESGVSRNMLIQVEWGQRGILAERLGDIADVLGVTAKDLLDSQPEAANPGRARLSSAAPGASPSDPNVVTNTQSGL